MEYCDHRDADGQKEYTWFERDARGIELGGCRLYPSGAADGAGDFSGRAAGRGISSEAPGRDSNCAGGRTPRPGLAMSTPSTWARSPSFVLVDVGSADVNERRLGSAMIIGPRSKA